MRKDKEIAIYLIGFASLAMSITAVCVACFRTDDLGFDYQGVIVGMLSLLVTVLIGWQIYSTIAMEARMRKVADEIVTRKAEDVKKSIYNSLSTTYISLIATSLMADKYLNAILYNECLIDCAINSGSKNIAKDIADNALSIAKKHGDKLGEHGRKMLKIHIESIKKKLVPAFPDIVEPLVSILHAMGEFP